MSLNKLLILSFFIFSIPSIGLALPECGNTLHNCTGTYTWENGDVYDGDWKNNKKHGKGKFVKTNGHSYEGDFVDNKFNGVGTITLPDKRVVVGFFRNNKLLYAKHEWESVKRNLCRKLSVTAKKNNIKYWESSEKKYKEFINKIPKDDLAKLGLINDYNDLINCFKKSLKIITSTPKQNLKILNPETNEMIKNLKKRLKAKGKELADKVEKENQQTVVNFQGRIIPLKIPDIKEYNSTKSVGLSKAHPAIKFIIENSGAKIGIGMINDKISAVEEVSLCTLKVRHNTSGRLRKSIGKVEKVYIDFNKANWKTWDITHEKNLNRITLSCPKNDCYFKYGLDWNGDTITWEPRTAIVITVSKGIMHRRLNDALRDLRNICNKSTSKY